MQSQVEQAVECKRRSALGVRHRERDTGYPGQAQVEVEVGAEGTAAGQVQGHGLLLEAVLPETVLGHLSLRELAEL